MTSAGVDGLVREVATAHRAGVLAAAEHIDVAFASGGLAFTAKRQPHGLARVEARLRPDRQCMRLAGDSPRSWHVDVADGDELRARLETIRGARRLRWRPEDLGAFAAAAIWSYVTLPILLDRADRVERVADRGGLRGLRLTLPPDVAGHGRRQTVYVDDRGLIRRHDYTATAFGRWARAAQLVTDYESFDGVPIGTTRRVTPRLGRPLPAPTLVWIRIHGLTLAGPDVARDVADRRAHRPNGRASLA